MSEPTIIKPQAVKRVRDAIACGSSVAKELLHLAGGDDELVIRESQLANGLDDCKARILDARMNGLAYSK